MKNLSTLLFIVGFLTTPLVALSVYAGSFLFFVLGIFGFVVMMKGLLMNVK